jgi:hypothetical protein
MLVNMASQKSTIWHSSSLRVSTHHSTKNLELLIFGFNTLQISGILLKKGHMRKVIPTRPFWLLQLFGYFSANDNLAWIRNNSELPAVKTYLDSAIEINPCVHYSLFGFVLCIFRCLIIRSWHQLSRWLRATILSIPRLVCFSSLWNMPEPPATKPQSK